MPDVKTRRLLRTQLKAPVFRHPAALAPEEEDDLIKLAQSTFDAFIASVTAEKAASDSRSVLFRGTTTIAAELYEVEAVMSNLTDVHIADSMGAYADGLLGSKILHHVHTSSDTHIVVRWFATECPKLVHHRDFSVVEIQKTLTLPTGRRAWAVVQHSVRLPSCPDFKDSLNFVRASMSTSGVLFAETSVLGQLDVHQRFEIDVRGTAPRWLAKHTMKAAALDFAKIEAHVHELRREEQDLSTFVVRMIPADSCTECYLCATKFHALKKKINCRLCGEVVCTNCHSSKRRGCLGCVEDPQDVVENEASSSRRDYAPTLAMESSKSYLDSMTSSFRSDDLANDLAEYTLSTTYLTASGVSTRLSDSARTIERKSVVSWETSPEELAIEPSGGMRKTWVGLKKLLQ
ncbi:hypothetical protein ACHHYP_15988 [Achlya hypogyna]|uniref:START domain-containing protein n=1 Tax=Achlya hypogyna TaxID=1202772 RepID=A0A1V9ZEH3_ACHHY|nr:hypothetical protein ACHHYP_15988 [Achlya hypogyna]